MTVVSSIAKYSRVDGLYNCIDFHGPCMLCKQRNRIRLGPTLRELDRETCPHFHDYTLAFLREGIVYFRFTAPPS